MIPFPVRVYAWPLFGWPTRAQLEAQLGHDPARLDRFAGVCWRLFRTLAVGSLAAVAAGAAATAGASVWVPLDAADRVSLWTMVRLLASLLGAAVLMYYPWPFRHQGSRAVRWAVLAVGVPSLCLVAAGVFGLA